MASIDEMKQLRSEIAATKKRIKVTETAVKAKEKANKAMEKVAAMSVEAAAPSPRERESVSRAVREKQDQIAARRAAYIAPVAPMPAPAPPRRSVGMAAPVRQGPVEDIMENSIYPITDEWGQTVPFWSGGLSLDTLGQTGTEWERRNLLDYWNYYMRGPRRLREELRQKLNI
jgi:hypothetical protein